MLRLIAAATALAAFRKRALAIILLCAAAAIPWDPGPGPLDVRAPGT